MEALLHNVVKRHARAILGVFQRQLQQTVPPSMFSPPGVVTLASDGEHLISDGEKAHVQSDGWDVIRVHLCGDEIVTITVDARTGQISLRDSGDLAAAGRGPRFSAISQKLNESPGLLIEALRRLRLAVSDNMITNHLTLTSSTDNCRFVGTKGGFFGTIMLSGA